MLITTANIVYKNCGYVYVLRYKGLYYDKKMKREVVGNIFKIGISRTPGKRFHSVRDALPEEFRKSLTRIAIAPVFFPKDNEKFWHQRFADIQVIPLGVGKNAGETEYFDLNIIDIIHLFVNLMQNCIFYALIAWGLPIVLVLLIIQKVSNCL